MPIADSGNFLVSPSVGVMIWTLIAFGITLLLLRRFAFPPINAALEKRQKTIDDSIEASERLRAEAEDLLDQYRERLAQARGQSDEIIARARASAENHEREVRDRANQEADERARHAQRDIDAATRRALQELRSEVADLTVLATEKVTRRALDPEQQRRLVQEAIGEIDFSVLAGVSEDDD